MRKHIGIVWFLIRNLPRLIKDKHVLIWIENKACIIPIEQAFAYQVAKKKGIEFSNADEFEAWYLQVATTDYKIGKPTKEVNHYGEGETITLYCI